MADKDRGRELPQRVKGAARSGPSASAPSSSPVLSEELRQRMRAAVTAERAGAATKQAAPKQDEAPVRSEAPVPSEAPVVSEPPVPSARAANAGPIAEDEITEWLGTTATPPPEVKLPPEVRPPPEVKPPSSSKAPTTGPPRRCRRSAARRRRPCGGRHLGGPAGPPAPQGLL